MRNGLKIGLSLGSGGGRGMAHIGVLEVFEREGFLPDYISGCSMGAITAAIFAAGVPMQSVHEMAHKLRQSQIADVGNVFTSLGLARGVRSLNIIKKYIGDISFADCKIPLAVTSTDLVTGQLVTFRSGPVWRAVRASYAIPSVFEPVRIDKRILVDGGLVERVPVQACRDMGADIVIVVDPIGKLQVISDFKNILSVVERAYMIFDNCCNVKKVEQEADFLIAPDLGGKSIFDFNNNDPAIEAGRIAAENSLESMYNFIDNFKKP